MEVDESGSLHNSSMNTSVLALKGTILCPLGRRREKKNARTAITICRGCVSSRDEWTRFQLRVSNRRVKEISYSLLVITGNENYLQYSDK